MIVIWESLYETLFKKKIKKKNLLFKRDTLTKQIRLELAFAKDVP